MALIRRQHDEHKRVSKTCGGGKTHQSFKDECDINVLMSKYERTGQLPEMIKKNPVYGDFSNPVDFQHAQNMVIKVNQQFNALDARVRERFANEPQKFLEWVSDPKNADEMASLGLMKKEAVQRVANAKNEASKAKVQPKKDEETK